MSDEELVSVASRSPMAMRITEPLPEEFRDKPGNAPALRSFVLNGANHPEAVGGVGYTHGVSAAVFRAWHAAHEAAHSAVHSLVSIVHRDNVPERAPELENGFEPGLARMVESQGVPEPTVIHEGPVTAAEMKPTSDTPNDDSPRGDPDVLNGETHAQEPATALVNGEHNAGDAEHHHD